MSLADLFNISRTVRRDKARDQDLLPATTSNSRVATRLCNICYAQPAAYNCPRCNIPFCSLLCFRRREHQECSAAFSSSEVGLAAGWSDLTAQDRERGKVADILHRLEEGEKESRQREEDALQSDSEEDDDLDESVRLRADVTAEQIESASDEALLAMLTPKERQRFLNALKSQQSAARFMERLDRKAHQRMQQESQGTQQGTLTTTSIPLNEAIAPKQRARMAWKSTPWFERPEACPPISGRPKRQISAFTGALEKVLVARATLATSKDAPAPVDLSYNLCTLVMAYAYTLRRMDITSLSGLTEPLTGRRTCLTSTEPVLNTKPAHDAKASCSSLHDSYDDDEPPPLEDDDPVNVRTTGSVSAATPEAQLVDRAELAQETFDKLASLLPFLFPQPTRTPNSSLPSASGRDPSKVVLLSLEDASMWLLSRLSLDSEVGQGGSDALLLQLLKDLSQILAGEQLVPTFSEDDEVEPKYLLASMLSSLPPQQAYAAAQTPLLLNAIADLSFFLEDLADLAASPSSALPRVLTKSKSVTLALRKLCFYLGNAILGDDTPAGRRSFKRTRLQLRQETQIHIDGLKQRIDAMDRADKLASAVSMLNRDESKRSP